MPLEKHLAAKHINVFELDMQGDCDLQANLDKLEKLPFTDNSFDLVCAFDVLEHLENFHFINEEILRVAKKYFNIATK